MLQALETIQNGSETYRTTHKTQMKELHEGINVNISFLIVGCTAGIIRALVPQDGSNILEAINSIKTTSEAFSKIDKVVQLATQTKLETGTCQIRLLRWCVELQAL